jgi:hypothetical protein
MPQFRNAKLDRFEIDIMPKNVLRYLFPFFVGDEVVLKMRITDTRQLLDSTSISVFEIFNGEEKIILKLDRVEIKKGWQIVSGNIIDREGDVIYKVGIGNAKSVNAKTIFSTSVINKDRWFVGCAGLIAGAVLATLGSIVAGLFSLKDILSLIDKMLK